VLEGPAEGPEVDVHDGGVLVPVEQVLADRVRPGQHRAVEEAGSVGEAPLGGADAHGVTREPRGVVAGEAVDRVSLGHDGTSTVA
jgi:hypothetical protein